MDRALRKHRNAARHGDRIPFHAQLHVTTLDGKPVAPLSRCTNIGLGGLRVAAEIGLAPGTRVQIELRLSAGKLFSTAGHVAWSRQTIHPKLLGSPEGRDDDALFGIAFDHSAPEDLVPIARLFAARDRELHRARRIRRLHGLPSRG